MAHRLGGTTLVLTTLTVAMACGGSASRGHANGETEGSGGSAAATAGGGRSGVTGGTGAGGQGQVGSGGEGVGGSGGGSGDPTGGGGSGAVGGAGGSVVVAGGNAGNMGVSGGTGGGDAGGSAGTGGATGGASGASAGAGAATVGGVGGTMGGEGGAGGGAVAGGTGGTVAGGTGGTGGTWHGPGPCDIYAAELTPCVAAYSMVRRLLSTYEGPLYQVRSESSSQNTGTGGTTHDIGMTAEGFADKEHQDEVCYGTLCTVSLLYDQSGHDNHLSVAKKGRSDGGEYAAHDDFESVATDGPLTVGSHDVYALYMDARQGYRTPVDVVGNSMPLHVDPQGIYLLADGTHSGSQCCWDFGNVSPDPTAYVVTNALFFGVAYWGGGAGDGPWFMADFEAGIWAGGTLRGDPGTPTGPPNENNPSLGVRFALGFLKTDQSNWALRMANLQTATSLVTAYDGSLPKQMNNPGGIVLGVDSSNSNNSWGTFYEGAIVSGYPSEDTELAVLQNIQGVGYGS